MVERKPMKRKRINYYDDYKKTASGEYIYAGVEYDFVGKDGKSRRRWMREVLFLSIAVFAALVVPGFFLVPGLNQCAYVLLPYAAGVLLTGYLLVVVIRLAAAKDSVKAWEYDKSVKVMPTTTKLVFGVSILSIICEIVYLFINGAENMVLGTVLFFVCEAAGAAMGYILIRCVKNADWKAKESKDI